MSTLTNPDERPDDDPAALDELDALALGHHDEEVDDADGKDPGDEDDDDGLDTADELGQATTEYALVLLGAALVALLLIGWATSGGGAGKVGHLLDAVLDAITSKL